MGRVRDALTALPVNSSISFPPLDLFLFKAEIKAMPDKAFVIRKDLVKAGNYRVWRAE